jgi:prepilin-type N-terminal cleavage/methylation domain-containing protein
VKKQKSKPKKQAGKHMRITNKQKSAQGFTLIEMIGVLAVIAILASMLIPKIFEAINSSRINNCVQSYNTIKAAVMDHYGKYGAINFLGVPAPGAIAPATALTNYDNAILLPEALIDKPLVVRVGTGSEVQAILGVAAGIGVTGANPAYDLDGSGAAVNDAATTGYVVESVVYGVAEADAYEISQRLDGNDMSTVPPAATGDLEGRVKYGVAAGDGTVELHIYVAHR